MKIEDIIDLTKAGFTKDDILKLSQIQPKEETKEETKEEPKETKEEPAVDYTQTITTKLDEILNAVQKGNLLNATNNVPKQDTIEDILTQIVNPTIKK